MEEKKWYIGYVMLYGTNTKKAKAIQEYFADFRQQLVVGEDRFVKLLEEIADEVERINAEFTKGRPLKRFLYRFDDGNQHLSISITVNGNHIVDVNFDFVKGEIK
jgi:hypothetical protein